MHSSGVGLVLLDPAQDPVEAPAGDLAAAVLADAGHVDLERGAAIRAALVPLPALRHAAPPDESPVLREAARAARVPAHDLPPGVERVVAHARPDADRH